MSEQEAAHNPNAEGAKACPFCKVEACPTITLKEVVDGGFVARQVWDCPKCRAWTSLERAVVVMPQVAAIIHQAQCQLAAEREARQRAEALLYRGCHDCAYDARSRSADQCDGCAVWAGLVAAGIEAPDPGADQDGTAQAPAADWDSGIATLDDTQYRCF